MKNRPPPSDQSPRPTVSMLCAKETVRRVLGEIGVLEPNIRQTADHPPPKSVVSMEPPDGSSTPRPTKVPVRRRSPSDQSPRPTVSMLCAKETVRRVIGEIGSQEPNIRQTADHPPPKSASLWSRRTEAVLPVRRRSPSDQSPRPTVSMLCAKETVRRVLGEIGVLEPNIRQTADHPPPKSVSLLSRRTEYINRPTFCLLKSRYIQKEI